MQSSTRKAKKSNGYRTEASTSSRRKDGGKRERRHNEEDALDEALRNTFPASDPVSIEQPVRAVVDSPLR